MAAIIPNPYANIDIDAAADFDGCIASGLSREQATECISVMYGINTDTTPAAAAAIAIATSANLLFAADP